MCSFFLWSGGSQPIYRCESDLKSETEDEKVVKDDGREREIVG